ncbi:MAG: DHHA1 domain-containing protein [Candidatus Zixiibacteriota bacterium]
MTERLYHNDSYLFEFQSVIVGLNNRAEGIEVILKETAFYPESGGQSADRGTLVESSVLNVYNGDNDTVIHLLEKCSANIGDSVRGVIDREYRLSNMRKHTGQHILSQALVRIAKAETVSAHLGEIESTIEVNLEGIDDRILDQCEIMTNEIIQQNLPIKTYFLTQEEMANREIRRIPDREGKFRIVEVDNFEITACGGTHVRNTGEIGLVKIIGMEKIRNHFRLTFLAGAEALSDYRIKHQVASDLSKKMTCHITDLNLTVNNLFEQNLQLRREINLLNKQMIPSEIGRLMEESIVIDSTHLIIDKYEHKDPAFVKELVLAFSKERGNISILKVDDKIQIGVSLGVNIKASEIAQIIMKECGGKGGGSDLFAQVGIIEIGNFEEFKNSIIKIILEKLTG